MSPSLQHGHADLGEVRLHYVTDGEGPAVVLIHGWPQTWFMWRDVIAGLAPRYRVIAPDLRGLGESSRPVGGDDKKTLAQDIWRLANDVLGEQRLFVVGHDWGGPTASRWRRSIATPSGVWRSSMRPCRATAQR